MDVFNLEIAYIIVRNLVLNIMFNFKHRKAFRFLEVELILLKKIILDQFRDIENTYIIIGPLDANIVIKDISFMLENLINDNALNLVIYSEGGDIIDTELLTNFFLKLKKNGMFIRTIGYNKVSSGAIPIFLSGSEKVILHNIEMYFHPILGYVSFYKDEIAEIDKLKSIILDQLDPEEDELKARQDINYILKILMKKQVRYINLLRKVTNGFFARREIKELMYSRTRLNQYDLLNMDLIDHYIPIGLKKGKHNVYI